MIKFKPLEDRVLIQLDTKDEKSLLQFLRLTMLWPMELGIYIDSKINQ